ncbi:MAG TPA: MaoC/PaaZ C-terminal domain-containing protein [Pseudonocardiaceae bacterium]
MAINPSAVGTKTTHGTLNWTSTDALLYAMGVGAGAHDPAQELAFTTENSHGVAQKVLPTFAVVIGSNEPPAEENPFAAIGDFSLAQILHGGQKVVLHGSLPVSGSVELTSVVTGIYDKGRNAVVETGAELRDVETGRLLAETVSTIVVRGEGGFGGNPGRTLAWEPPDRSPDVVVSYPTAPSQALLYRLSGDRNPLHADPWFARQAGLDRPILHGLCTYGFTGRALLHEVCGGDPAVFGSMDARFSAMVHPSDVIDVRIWKTEYGARFQSWVGDRVVLDRGEFVLRAS